MLVGAEGEGVRVIECDAITVRLEQPNELVQPRRLEVTMLEENRRRRPLSAEIDLLDHVIIEALKVDVKEVDLVT